MNEEPEPVMLSALQHYLFCPRQFALIHVEGVWRENYLTAAGHVLHERVDRPGAESRRDVHIATSLRLVSRRVGLIGVADMVEFLRVDAPVDARGCRVASELPELSGWWRPFPIEYKHGRPKTHRADEVQLCAQAICLEEMLDVTIPEGALFYGETRRRTAVAFDRDLRELTESTARRARELIDAGQTPPAVQRDCCEACSIKDLCRPKTEGRSAAAWVEAALTQSAEMN